MSGQNLAWKDFRSRMREKRSGRKRKSYYGFKTLFTSLTQKRFQASWENTNKSSLQKVYICNLNSNADSAFPGSYCLSSLFLQPWQRRRRNREREHIIKKKS